MLLDIENGYSVFFFKVTAKVDTEDHANYLINQFAEGRKVGSYTLRRKFDIRQGFEGEKYTVYAQVIYYQLEKYCKVLRQATESFELNLVGRVIQVPRDSFERLFPIIRDMKYRYSVMFIIRRRSTAPLIGVKGLEHRVIKAVDAITELVEKELL